MAFRELLNQKHDAEFYQKAMDLVHALQEEKQRFGVQIEDVPTRADGLILQHVFVVPPDRKKGFGDKVQTLAIKKRTPKPILDYLNGELKKSADNGHLCWDERMYRRKHIGLLQDEDGFTGISLPFIGSNGYDISTALNELEVAINAKLHELQKSPPGRKQ